MPDKPRMSAMPPRPTSAEEFIAGAEIPRQVAPAKKKKFQLPWEASTVRSDVKKGVNLQLTEPWLLKLQFLSEQTNKSQQLLIREALEPFLDSQIKKIIEA
jgi:hypothetical protein